LVVEIDEHGEATAAYIPGMRSPELDACVLKEIHDYRWEFEPARECSGDPLAGQYVTEEGIVCGPRAGGDERPNKGMKQTKPAQAMELRSLSPVLGRQVE
jgi:hypothetical protein